MVECKWWVFGVSCKECGYLVFYGYMWENWIWKCCIFE